MAHFGIICSPVPGHINPTSTIGRELIARGHKVTCFNIADVKEKVLSEGINFEVIGEDLFPIGAWTKFWGDLASKSGLRALIGTVIVHKKIAYVTCRDIPALCEKQEVDCLLIDQVQFQGFVIAKKCKIPFITIGCALLLNKDSGNTLPPPIVPWGPGNSIYGKTLNFFATKIYELFASPILNEGNRWARKWGVEGALDIEDSFSKFLQVFPLSRSLDFKRNIYRNSYLYVGSLIDSKRPMIEVDLNKYQGKKIVYASLGTLQNGIEDIFQIIDEAFLGRDEYQLVISLGTKNTNIDKKKFKNALVLDFAPQLELIKRSHFIITHGGMNTVSEALTLAKPMIVIPITNDQPAVAARVKEKNVGIVIPLSKVNVEKLNFSIEAISKAQSFFDSAKKVSEEIEREGGVKKAADKIEEVVAWIKNGL